MDIESMAKAERRAYLKDWRAKNKDKVKQHNQNYWNKRAEQKIKAGEINANNTHNENN